MSVYQEYLESVEDEKKRHNEELEKLKAALKVAQANCPHPKWERDEAMFYALGETAPGEMCVACGQKRRIKD